MTTLLAIIAFALQPALAEPTEHLAACIEKNNFHDGEGRLVFTQLIVWQDELPYANVVKDWRMYDKINPIVTRRGNEWRMTFWDEAFHTMRVIRSPSFIETWTQHDPELLDRERVKTECRSGLGEPRKR